MILLIHIIFGVLLVLVSVFSLVHKSTKLSHDNLKLSSIVMLTGFTTMSGILLVVQGASLVHFCFSGLTLMAFSVFAGYKVYRRSAIRIEF